MYEIQTVNGEPMQAYLPNEHSWRKISGSALTGSSEGTADSDC